MQTFRHGSAVILIYCLQLRQEANAVVRKMTNEPTLKNWLFRARWPQQWSGTVPRPTVPSAPYGGLWIGVHKMDIRSERKMDYRKRIVHNYAP